MTKEFILSEIQRTAEANQGQPLGKGTFFKETGLKESDWYGKYWTKWGDAVKEAGFEPNVLTPAFSAEFLLNKLKDLVSEIQQFPTKGDIRLKAFNDKTFPSHNTFERFGNKAKMAKTLYEFCIKEGFNEVAEICSPLLKNEEIIDSEIEDETKENENGSVYLYKSGTFFKIGRTNNLKRRDREIQLQLPIEAELIHRIITDDPVGIEKYWHNRFADKRMNGEWFKLSAADIKAFRRRTFM